MDFEERSDMKSIVRSVKKGFFRGMACLLAAVMLLCASGALDARARGRTGLAEREQLDVGHLRRPPTE